MAKRTVTTSIETPIQSEPSALPVLLETSEVSSIVENTATETQETVKTTGQLILEEMSWIKTRLEQLTTLTDSTSLSERQTTELKTEIANLRLELSNLKESLRQSERESQDSTPLVPSTLLVPETSPVPSGEVDPQAAETEQTETPEERPRRKRRAI